jgi:hypothetical protein
MRLSSSPYALHAPPISFFSILSPEQYSVRGRNQPIFRQNCVRNEVETWKRNYIFFILFTMFYINGSLSREGHVLIHENSCGSHYRNTDAQLLFTLLPHRAAYSCLSTALSPGNFSLCLGRRSSCGDITHLPKANGFSDPVITK